MIDSASSSARRGGTLTAAAAALRAGWPALASSFRLHRPRGAFCHAGWCQQCRTTLSDGRIVLACRTTESVRPVDRLWKRLLARFAEDLPPWFYEQRLLRPRSLRQFYLERLRRLSAAPALPEAPAQIAGRWNQRRCKVLVVGGGLAGLEAARAHAAAGEDVLLIEAEESLGGRARFQPAAASALSQALHATADLPKLLGTLCAGLYENAREALLIGPEGPIVLGFEELVVATGAYDRLPSFAGNDLPGIVGLRGFERLSAAKALPPSWRIGVFADAPGIEAALATGESFAFIACPDDLRPSDNLRLSRATLVSAEGKGRLRALHFDPGGRLDCDLLVLGFSQPSYELQMQAGQTAEIAGSPAVVLTSGEAMIPLSVVGDAALRPPPPPDARNPVSRPATGSFICFCEDVRRRDAEVAIAEGFDDIELLKRRTGAGTGPCQGKLCHGEMLACLAAAGRPVALPTVRPLLRPVSLAELAAADHE